MAVRKVLLPRIEKNKKEQEALETYAMGQAESGGVRQKPDILDNLIDIREYDVPYNQRVCIDTGLRVGLWYDCSPISGSMGCEFEERKDLEHRPLISTLAYDIETTKLPLKFPNAEHDQVMMISYMLNGIGYLIVNREIVSEDIEDFEYTPKPEYPGPFQMFNEANELAVLQRFFTHIREVRPLIYVTYNGDFFDWPFVDARAQKHGMSLKEEIGVWGDKTGEYMGRFCVHLDCFCWVKRDSYLPQGSQGLKAVTKSKLGYNPLELDPEDMLPFASENPQALASYSVSDAVATFYLYKKYIHLFIYSLCCIIPMPPADVLRKGSGTLCEVLLMVKAADGGILCPNKQQKELAKFHNGHLLESETYIGGHVECLESGIFRADLTYKFKIVPARIQELLDNLDRTVEFAITEEAGTPMEECLNVEEVTAQIREQLIALRDTPNIEVKPLIYHLDVAAMYPNIILTNRLQPMAIVDQATCASCDFNRPGKNCQRHLNWAWRGKWFPATRSEYEGIKAQLEVETVKESDRPKQAEGDRFRRPVSSFLDLPPAEQAKAVENRVKSYSHKVYKKLTSEEVEEKTAITCQRENPFYVNTVRAFRDRRYTYKRLTAKWGQNLKEAKGAVDIANAKDMVLLYDSMQLAHKCILNSFYGYVMRTGARWHSIEMAGVVTYTGAQIIKDARMLVEDIGRPLELDTDGIWAILPATFPENFKVKTKKSEAGEGRPITLSYPCSMLNIIVKDKYSNPQYQDLVDEQKKTYKTSSPCTIAFEVDGPYRAMVLPAAKEEGKNIKKRYAVFNFDGSLAELKGFEIKRRGELQLIKVFQGQVFKSFLGGKTLEEVYKVVGDVANHWLDVMYSHGKDLEDEDVFDLISENKSMSNSLASYGNARSTSITCARRIGEFLGAEMVQDKGLNCKFIVANKPHGASTSDRAIPVAIFSAEDAVKKYYLRKWLKDSAMNTFDIRDILDWDYYIGRLGSAIQKIITIPAAFQKVANPVPRVPHPDWLLKRVRERNDTRKQAKLSNFFNAGAALGDLEDIGSQVPSSQASSFQSPLRPTFARVNRRAGVKRGQMTLGFEAKSSSALSEDDEDGQDNDNGSNADSDLHMAGDMKMSPAKSDQHRAAPQAEEEEVVADPPNQEEDMKGWISNQQQHWRLLKKRKREARLLREAEAKRNTENKEGDKRQRTLGDGVASYFRETAKKIATNYWQILQIAEDESSPGVYRVWAFTDSKTLQKVDITVPRVLYLNTRVVLDAAAAMGKKVEKTLPRGRTAMHLYECVMSESEFKAQNKELSTFMNHSEVEGVYETKVPLLFKLLCELGCVCKVKEGSRKKSLAGAAAAAAGGDTAQFDISDLTYKTTAECSYLQDVNLRKIFLYHTAMDSRGLFGLVVEGESEVLVVAVTTARSPVEAVNLRSVARKCAAAAGQEGSELDNATFAVRQVTSNTAAWRLIRERLQQQRATSTSPTMVLSQCVEPLSVVYNHLPILKAEYPVVTVPSPDIDSNYPTLNWYSHSSKRLLQRYFQSGSWWEDQLGVCRYVHVPIGNIAADYPAFVSDVFFARSLRASNHLLWASAGLKPDLGGLEEDDNYFEDEHSNPELCTPGCFRDICVELDVSHLAIDTVLKSNLIEELEGGMGMRAAVEASENTDNKMSEELSQGSYACREAFKVLKSTLSGWVNDTVRDQNPVSDMLLSHFYRWLRTPTSFLFDPSLHQMVHKMMKKVWLQLLQRFRKLGSTVVYATFQKLIVATGKPSVERGVAYCKYVLETIKDRPLFQWLDVEPTLMWESFIFMDAANYGGIIAKGQREDEEEELEDDDPEVVSHWNVADYLPDLAREYFNVVVAEFCILPFKHRKSLETDHPSQDLSQSSQFVNPEDKAARARKYLGELVSDYLSTRLFTITKEIQTYLSGDLRSGDTAAPDFPQLAGSYLPLHNPALEFVKAICYIVSLDPAVKAEANTLRANLMKLVDIKAFSKESEFVNPCLTLVMPDVICSYCNACRDLDLCRDPDLTSHNWKCTSCQQQYDKTMVELALVELCNRRSVSYQLQDLACSSCGRQKISNLGSFCQCSGTYQVETDPKSFDLSMQCFANIAKFHNFPWLAETVRFIRDH